MIGPEPLQKPIIEEWDCGFDICDWRRLAVKQHFLMHMMFGTDTLAGLMLAGRSEAEIEGLLR